LQHQLRLRRDAKFRTAKFRTAKFRDAKLRDAKLRDARDSLTVARLTKKSVT